MKKNVRKNREDYHEKNNSKGSIIQNIIIVALVIMVGATFVIGSINSNKTLAKNKSEYDEAIQLAKDEEERISRLNVYELIKEGKDINLLIFGDEIGSGTGVELKDDIWYEKLKQWLKDEYNSNISITNLATNSTSIYDEFNNLDNIDFSKFQLVILSFDLQKDILSESNFKGIYETILRKIKAENNLGDIIPVVNHDANNEMGTIVGELSNHYNLNGANFSKEFNGNAELLLEDGVTDSTLGHELYFETIKNIIATNVEGNKKCSYIEQVLHSDEVETFKTNEFITEYVASEGFEAQGDRIFSSEEGSWVEYQVNSKVVGLSYLTSINGGVIEVYLDGKKIKEIDTKSEHENKEYVVIANSLKDSNTIKLVLRGEDSSVEIFGLVCSGSINVIAEETSNTVKEERPVVNNSTASNGTTNNGSNNNSSGSNSTTTNKPSGGTSNGTGNSNNSGSDNSSNNNSKPGSSENDNSESNSDGNGTNSEDDSSSSNGSGGTDEEAGDGSNDGSQDGSNSGNNSGSENSGESNGNSQSGDTDTNENDDTSSQSEVD